MSSSLTKCNTSERQVERYTSYYRDLFVTYEGVSEEIPLRPPDLSVQGMFIQTGRRFPEGAVLRIRFHLVNSRYEVVVRGEVRYCLPGVGLGIEFLEISPEARQAIQSELQNAAAPASRKS